MEGVMTSYYLQRKKLSTGGDIMRWFKHFCSLRNSEAVAELEERAGLEGYGFYTKMCEIVAESMDYTEKCSLCFSSQRWAKQLNITVKKFNFLAQCCADVGLISLQYQSDVGKKTAQKITVKIPNLLNLKDTYSKNLEVNYKPLRSGLEATSKQLLSKEEEVEVEVEERKKDIDIGRGVRGETTNAELAESSFAAHADALQPQSIADNAVLVSGKTENNDTDVLTHENEQTHTNTHIEQKKRDREPKNADLGYSDGNKKPKKPNTAKKTAMPKGFCLSERVRKWAKIRGVTRLDDHFDHFSLVATARGYTYADWDAALMRAIRDDWAKIADKKNPLSFVAPEFQHYPDDVVTDL